MIDTDALDTPCARLAWARRRAGYADKAEFARAAGINVITYRSYESGQNGFAKLAASLGRKLGVSGDWLLEGGPLPDRPLPVPNAASLVANNYLKSVPSNPSVLSSGAIQLKRVDLGLSMGDGTNLDDYVEEEPFEFDGNLLSAITRAPPERVIIARGDGDSMFPTLVNDDMVAIDTTQTRLNLMDRVWAISLFGAGGIKRLRRVAGGQVEVISDNPDRDNQTVDEDALRILGRVIWVGRRI